ncbi:Protein CBR-TRY-4 [Caenorhabditis briggsae]|uniref:Peptidase S1 domain-containing protein n=2 Tax=Caenorhabditis briggsae TaxID=6238 RepID=A0AAE9ADK5_CAEBR|nr:Protein CBR-TRY-4 [Caenorhabditis briggsae]ULT92661.1 hypothetical protein L3Y34_010034 [Caenorhabditis briggsae]CAP26017.2 Protein CBR-TRY-4 [Caenorhabditis briggsae]
MLEKIAVVVLSLATVPSVITFQPIWIGDSFSEKSFLSPLQNELLWETCGVQKESKHKEFPWAVSFTVDGVNRLGGSIISPYHILTAAHGFVTTIGARGNLCMDRDLKHPNSSVYRSIEFLRETRKVAYGGKCIRGFTEEYPNDIRCKKPDVIHNKIRSVLVDGDFAASNCTSGHDWAIVEVEKRIQFGKDVQPICLPRPNMYYTRSLTVPGWGRSYIFNESGPLIHEIPMRVDRDCRRPWSDRLPADANDYVCATSMDIYNYSAPRTCHGDSGGGLEYRDDFGRAILIAITSFGTRGCPSNMLARFTRVDVYLDLICKYTGVCYY